MHLSNGQRDARRQNDGHVDIGDKGYGVTDSKQVVKEIRVTSHHTK